MSKFANLLTTKLRAAKQPADVAAKKRKPKQRFKRLLIATNPDKVLKLRNFLKNAYQNIIVHCVSLSYYNKIWNARLMYFYLCERKYKSSKIRHNATKGNPAIQSLQSLFFVLSFALTFALTYGAK